MTQDDIYKAVRSYLTRHGRQSAELRAVFFDMDGVLYDTMKAHCRAWMESASEAGLTMSEQDCYRYEGQTGSYTIRLLYQSCLGRDPLPEEVKQLYTRKTELFGRYTTGSVIPHAPQVVQSLEDLERILVTGSSQPSLLERLAETYPGVFSRERMITGKDVRIGKPHPEPYLMAQERVGVAPYESLVVENAPVGVCAAHAAGSLVVAVNTGPLADEELWREGADLVLPDMSALLVALPTIRDAYAHSR